MSKNCRKYFHGWNFCFFLVFNMSQILLMVFIALAAAAHAASFADTVNEDWHAFKVPDECFWLLFAKHGAVLSFTCQLTISSFILQSLYKKAYASEFEEKFRLKVFTHNRYEIEKHNRLYALGQFSYNLKLNKYSDLLYYEIVRQFNGFNKTSSSK